MPCWIAILHGIASSRDVLHPRSVGTSGGDECSSDRLARRRHPSAAQPGHVITMLSPFDLDFPLPAYSKLSWPGCLVSRRAPRISERSSPRHGYLNRPLGECSQDLPRIVRPPAPDLTTSGLPPAQGRVLSSAGTRARVCKLAAMCMLAWTLAPGEHRLRRRSRARLERPVHSYHGCFVVTGIPDLLAPEVPITRALPYVYKRRRSTPAYAELLGVFILPPDWNQCCKVAVFSGGRTEPS